MTTDGLLSLSENFKNYRAAFSVNGMDRSGELPVKRVRHHGSRTATLQGDHGESGPDGNGTISRGQTAPGPGRVEEANLPEPPEDTSQPLPAPPGGHEWEALQAAVNDSVAAFGAAAAKMGWKKWALTRAHSALLVSLFWWVVAAAFRADHSLSRPVQDFAFGHFCRHYVTVVLRLRGKARDQYQQVWIEMMAAAALYLLAEVFPRSQHKFDDSVRALITKQLRLWTAGALPADMHPSAHADAHDAAPAAFAVAAAATAAPLPGAPRSQQQARFAPGTGQELQASVRTFSNPANSGMSQTMGPPWRSLSSTFRETASASADAGPGGRLGGPQAFVFTKNSPVMAQMLTGAGPVPAGADGVVAGAPPVIKGLMKNTVGGTLGRMHRALDEDEDWSYSRLAAAATASASDAVSAYDSSKRAAAADAVALRRGLVDARGAIEARQRAALTAGSGHVKQMSDRLSGYIQNDVDRLLAGQPVSNGPGHSSAEMPRYLRPTGSAEASSVVKPARLMAPLFEVRRVEGNIRAALAGGRHSSTDTAARVAALSAAREAAAAADWRPLSQYPVGTKDTRRRKMAATILHGLDLDRYS
ncbi:hypothetical protein GPECTOR_4g572 [Gonium pectorale]|uniref:Uncharacterized protein n=1 Tax=Gonium pectorale TaxID=33097 RepID=A0A150GX97_GONPE|nr:hypothetical protein GPECTOR_4g572 [Gonium pectorale]|eukprot:KXZ54507.1 hypothetical protein GPECTOR_4g572 [Gonium pectorale]